MPGSGRSLDQEFNKVLHFDSKSWDFRTLAINDEVATYFFYLGSGATQEVNIYSRFWGTDSNTGCNYFFNCIGV